MAIKLKDILESVVGGTLPAAGQLWPFADKESYAKKWETSRLKRLFQASLEGMTAVDSIMDDNTVGDMKGQEFSGSSKKTHAKGLQHGSLPGWKVVKNPHPFSKGKDFKNHQTPKHKRADDGPLEDPSAGRNYFSTPSKKNK